MADFNLYAPTLIHWEGGYVNNPNDHGGPTKYGVTLQEWIAEGHDENGDNIINAADVKLITKDEALKIAKTIYWDKIKGDDISSQSIAEFLCDFAYNSGIETAIRKLQKVINVTIDGDLGPKTLAAINSSNHEETFNMLKQSRIDLVNAIVHNHPSQKEFLKGWLIRINSFKFIN